MPVTRRSTRAAEQPAGSPSLWRRVWGAMRWFFPPAAQWSAALPAFGWATISAGLLRLTLTPLHWAVLAPVAMVALFWGLRRCRPAMAFWVGWWWGSLLSFWWIGWFTSVARFNPFVYAGIPPGSMLLGVHAAIVLALIVALGRRLPPWLALGAGMMLWAGMDYFRMVGRLGIPYALPGQSLLGWSQVAQIAAIGGLPMLGALMAGLGLAGMEVIAAFRARYGQAGALARLGAVVGLLVAAHVYGSGRISMLDARDAEESDPLRVALVQTAIDQELKYASYSIEDDAERHRLQDEMFVSLLDQLETIEPGSVDLVVTPESALTHDFVDAEEAVQRRLYGGVPMLELMNRATFLDVPIVVGGVDMQFSTRDGKPTEFLTEGVDSEGRFNDGYQTYGGLWLLRPGEAAVRKQADYRKVRLMPFGEEVPYFDIIPGFQEYIVQVGTFAKGVLAAPLGIRIDRGFEVEPIDMAFGPSICFEDQFPYIHRHWARNGARFFVNSTNDAWFDGSSGPAFHLHSARWRSIETGIPMVRATNSGVTAVIDSTGRIQESFPIGERAVYTAVVNVPREPQRTIYTRFGDWFGLLNLLGSIVVICLVRPWQDAKRNEEE